MAIRKEVLDELLKDYKGPEDLTGEEGGAETADQSAS